MVLSLLLSKALLGGILGLLVIGEARNNSCSVPIIRKKNGNEKKIVEVNIRKDVKLTCQIRINGQNPKPRWYWLKNNDTLSTADHPRMRIKLYKYLKIKEVRKEDAGFYTCVAVNDCGENPYTMQLFVGSPTLDPNQNSTPVAPKFSVSQVKLRRNNLEVPVGNSVKLDCSADGHPRPTVKWHKDGALFKERKGGSRVRLSRWTTLLSLRDLMPTDSGTYTCNVSNPYGWINHTYRVDVHERARAGPVVLSMENVTVYEGENASLLCKALSDSMPHFQWLRWFPLPSNGSANGSIEHPYYEVINKDDTNQLVVVPPNNNRKFDFHGVKLTLVNITSKDEGKFTCIVGNAVGYAVEHAYVIVQKIVTKDEDVTTSPVIIIPPANTTAELGDNVTLKCAAEGKPKPKIRWQTEGTHYEDLGEDENEVSFFTLTVVKEVTAVRCEAQNIRNIDHRIAYISAAKDNQEINVSRNTKDDNQATGGAVGGIISAGILIVVALLVIWYRCRSRSLNTTERSIELSNLQFEYDAFVIFSSEDSDWVVKTLIPTLEEKHGLKCCVHYRDFILGVPIRQNMVDSVYKCRKTVAIMSTNFVNSNYCGSELDYALHRLMERKDDSLVVIKLDDVDREKLPKELQKRSYIDYPKAVEKENWEKKLIHCLKVPSYLPQNHIF